MYIKNKSIGFTIGASFIVLMLTTFCVIGYLVFSNWKASADTITTKIESYTNRDILSKMDEFTNMPFRINQINHYLFEAGIVNIYDKKKREIFFSGVIKANNDEVYSFSYGTETGEYYGARRNVNHEIEVMENNVETNGKTQYYSVTKDLTADKFVEETVKFDPRTRDWYKAASGNRIKNTQYCK